MQKKILKFAFFRKLSPELLSPYQLDDKTFVECRAVPGAKVTLFYRLDTGLGAETAYKCEPLKEMYQGIFVRTFTLFYGETLQYYFQIDEGDKDNTKKTSERSVSMKKSRGCLWKQVSDAEYRCCLQEDWTNAGSDRQSERLSQTGTVC